MAKAKETKTVKAKATPKAEPKVRKPAVRKAKPVEITVEHQFDACLQSDLELVIASCGAHASEVALKVNPTNIFALRYEALATAAQDLIDLFAERGHTGIKLEESSDVSQ